MYTLTTPHAIKSFIELANKYEERAYSLLEVTMCELDGNQTLSELPMRQRINLYRAYRDMDCITNNQTPVERALFKDYTTEECHDLFLQTSDMIAAIITRSRSVVYGSYNHYRQSIANEIPVPHVPVNTPDA